MGELIAFLKTHTAGLTTAAAGGSLGDMMLTYVAPSAM
jgi:hypothetical protein